MYNLAPMKLEAFRIDSGTLESVNTIVKLRKIRGGKSKFYRDAIEEKVAREKKKFQDLSKAMNG